MSEPAKQEWLTSAEAASMMRISVNALHKLVERGRIAPDYRGGQGGTLSGHRWRVETIEAFLRNGSGEP